MPDDIIKTALEQFEQSQSATSEIREKALDDIKFARMADQWPEKIRKERENDSRPCLTINRLPSFIRQVVNDGRMNNPAIAVHPVDSGADPETATVIGGLIKAIERGSNAAVAYDTALEAAVTSSFGFFRVTTDYENSESFDLEARIERISNPFSVHWDESSTQFDASDWGFAFVSDFLTQAEFEKKYPGKDASSFETGRGDIAKDWMGEDKIRVAEYWNRSENKGRLLLLSNGAAIRKDKLDDETKSLLGEGWLTVLRERDATFHTVKRRLITAQDILEEDEWPGTMIPICPVWGEEVIFDGKRYFRSLVRDAKDPQAMFNFWRSASTELVALAPRAPWVGPLGFVPEGQEEKWRTANTRSHAYLEFDPTGGGAPQRQPFAGVPAGAIQEAMNAADDMKAIMGIFDASLGARSNETSGKAIMARQREGDVSTFHFVDNLSRAIQYAGRVLVEIIPSIYSQRQAIRILGEDDAPKIIKLSEPRQDGKLYDLSVGKYDVTVKTGPSFTTQREEAQSAITEIMRAVPSAAPILGDLLLKNMDWPGADIVAKRLKFLLPPQIQQAEAQEALPNMPPEAQQALVQAMGTIKQLQEQVKQLQDKTAPEMARIQADRQHRAASTNLEQQRIDLDKQQFQVGVLSDLIRAAADMTQRQQPAQVPPQQTF